MPLILPGNVASATAAAYEVANSCRFDDTANDQLSKTYGGDGNMRTWTLSMWFKRADLGKAQYFFGGGNGSSVGNFLRLNDDDTLEVYSYNNGTEWQLTTSAVFRDISAWMHVVVRMDNTQGTEGNRLRIYVNGTQVTSFGTSNYPSQNTDYYINDATYPHYISMGALGAYVAEVFFCDGQSYAATSFGEFDEDSPTIWKPKDCKADLTFGTNGFYLDFEDTGAGLGADVSGNSNDFTEVNLDATDQATDTPTNNFATANPLIGTGIGAYAEGNLKVTGISANWTTAFSTIAVSSGKWYAEGKSLHTSQMAGIIDIDQAHARINGFPGQSSRGWGYETTGTLWNNGGYTEDWGDTYTTNDIIGVALDLDNHKLYFSKNGTWQNSGDPTSGATGTGAISITSGYNYYIAYSPVDSTSSIWEINFGNPSFSISSGNADANGYGNFEYAPPSGYYALCTKNLAEFGG